MDGERYLRSSALRAPLFWAAERVLITSIALAKRTDFPRRHAA